MAFNLARLRPTRTTLAVVVGLIWAISFGAIRDFVWADLREGMIDLRGLSRVTRGLILLGFGLLLVMVVVLLYNDAWRALFDLRPLVSSTPGRGSMIPVALAPVTLFLTAIAWSFGLTGALHCHPLLRLMVLGFFVLGALQWIASSAAFLPAHEQWLLWGALALILLLFAARWRARPRPGPEFVLLFLPVAAIFILVHARGAAQDELTGVALSLEVLHANMSFSSSLVLPLLTLIGVDIALFTYQAASWTTEIVEERLPRVALYGGLLLLALWRLRDVALSNMGHMAALGWGEVGPGYLGAFGVPLLVCLAAWAVRRLSTDRGARLSPDTVMEEAEGRAFPLILTYSLVSLLSFALLYIGAASGLGMLHSPAVRAWTLRALALMFAVNDWLLRYTDHWHTLVLAGALVAGLWLARRGRVAAGLYLTIFGARALWYWATAPGQPLSALTWRDSEPLDLWWLLLLLGVGALWALRRELTPERAARLLLLLLITILLEQTDFIENPFSPFFAFAGIGFLAFGIVWDALTAGTWANESSPALPRVSRLFLYVGYVLLTVTAVNWALTTHDLTAVGRFTGDAALAGLELFGTPLLYAVIIATLWLPAREEEPDEATGGAVVVE